MLESYISYLHRLSNKLGIIVPKCWCAPNTSKKIETLKPESTKHDSTYDLNFYERNIQIKHITGPVIQQFVEIVHRSLPVGVYLSIHPYDHKLHEMSRYIPDYELAKYKVELEQLIANNKDDFEDKKK